jgi:hypothetical protein
MDMECCPARSPSSACRRLPGGTRRLSIWSAASSAESFRSARRSISGGSRPELPVVQNRSVCLSANDLITILNVTRHVMRVKAGQSRVARPLGFSRAAVRASDLERTDDLPIRRRRLLHVSNLGRGFAAPQHQSPARPGVDARRIMRQPVVATDHVPCRLSALRYRQGDGSARPE